MRDEPMLPFPQIILLEQKYTHHVTTDVYNWCSGNFSKIELSTSLDSLKNSASFDIWLD